MSLDRIRSEISPYLNTTITKARPVGGGSIASSYYLQTESGDEYFAKSYADSGLKDICRLEAAGLDALRVCKEIKVPHVIAQTEVFLILEWIKESSSATSKFWEKFGKAFAALHKLQNESYVGYCWKKLIRDKQRLNHH